MRYIEWLTGEIRRLENNHARTLTRGQEIQLSVLRSVRAKFHELGGKPTVLWFARGDSGEPVMVDSDNIQALEFLPSGDILCLYAAGDADTFAPLNYK